MSQLIDPGLFKGDGQGGETQAVGREAPFATPYATPAPTGLGFKDLRGQTIVTIVLMVVALVSNLAFNIVGTVTDPESEAFGLAALGYLVFALIGFVAMLVWFYRATKNARAIASGLETKPGWAVGYFFIPIMSLYRPYRTISELWRSAMLPIGWRSQSDPVQLRFWWGGWLVGALAGSLASRIEPGVGPVTWAATLIGGAADLLFCLLAWQIAKAQVENKDTTVFD
ncbi:MAG: DUF4328 domain-containing protein [Caulobacter sp.]|nr:DUF4328 domain-containing protein [Caulobacter sp.]